MMGKHYFKYYSYYLIYLSKDKINNFNTVSFTIYNTQTIIYQIKYSQSNLIMHILEAYTKAWQNIILPKKITHRIQTYCPKKIEIQGHFLQRIDFEVFNHQNKRIEGIILKQHNIDAEETIVYLHGNGSSKLEALNFINLVCRNNVNIVCFDFIGCGNSDEGYLTYGVNESQDLNCVLNEIGKYLKLNKVCIWGRSMGALTGIVFASKYGYKISKIVLDSPFQYLSEVVKGIISNETSLSDYLTKLLFFMLKKSVEGRLQFGLFDIDYVDFVKKIPKNVPFLVLYSNNDNIVNKEMVEKVFDKVRSSEKQLLKIEETHEEDRKSSVLEEVLGWIKKSNSARRKTARLKIICQNEQSYTLNQCSNVFGC